MTSTLSLDESFQADLMSAAVRLYEIGKYDSCLGLLYILMKKNCKESFVLAGHCFNNDSISGSKSISNSFYTSACELGSAVGCYNVYLNETGIRDDVASQFLVRARELGWEE